tara:strand:+ start:9849 stop:11192 length:1344 start_codon:yes stop_codon:yes gene_type:complete
MTTSIARTLTSNGSRRKGTLSFWYKKCEVGTSRMVYQSYTSGGNNHNILFNTDDTLRFTSQVSSSKKIDLVTTRKFRDPNAWYHIVTAFDTEQGTDTNRAKMYINGVQETSFTNASGGSPTYPSQDQDLQVNISGEHIYFNKNGDGAGMEATCVYSHIHYIDGTMYDASAFGSFDSTTGEWKINTSPSVTYGTNGFFILKDGNSVTDQSGNSNNFTVGSGTLTKTEDNPSNVFATLNPLVKVAGNVTYSSGNTKVDRSGSDAWRTCYSTLGMTTGKYYFETLKNSGANNIVGIRGAEQADGSTSGSGNDYIAHTSQGWGLYDNDGIPRHNGTTLGSAIGTYANGDYIGVFLDCDNLKLYFSKNGTMLNTTGYSLTAGLTYMFGVSVYDNGGSLSCNFGNGAFGSTQLTGTTYNGSDGNGIFKYDPNNITLDGSSKSFKSLSTKGLNT